MLPSGTKTYLANYRVKGRLRRQTIARHGVVTPEQARDRARQILAQAADGKDPLAEKRAAAVAGTTMAQLAELYLKEGPGEKPNKKASSWAIDLSNIRRHITPLLGNRPVRDLTQADIARFQTDIAAGRSKADVKTKARGQAMVSGGRGTAARSLAVLGGMLEFAVKRNVIRANPARGVPLFKLEPRERFLSELEIAALADAITTLAAQGTLSRCAAIRLLLLTGCRKSEILSLRWDWIDLERGYLRLPDSKTGAKTVPLASAAVELLAGLPRRSPYVLPAARGSGHYAGLQKEWEQLRHEAQLPGLRIHDLRHSFASFAIAGGVSLHITGKILGHKQARTTEIYAHLADDPLRQAVERTAERIVAAMQHPARRRRG